MSSGTRMDYIIRSTNRLFCGRKVQWVDYKSIEKKRYNYPSAITENDRYPNFLCHMDKQHI